MLDVLDGEDLWKFVVGVGTEYSCAGSRNYAMM